MHMSYKKFFSWLFYTSNICALLSLGVVLAFGAPNILYGAPLEFVAPFILIPLILGCIFIFSVKVYKEHTRHKKILIKPLWLQKMLYILVTIVAWVITCVVVWATWDMLSDKPPQFFSFNDPNGTYTIIYEMDRYFLDYVTTTGNTYAYCNANSGVTTCKMTVFIASSPVDLKQFLNKQVKLKGEFITAHKQCIENSCKDYGSNFAGLRIDSITQKN